MKEMTKKVVILNNFTSPYISQAIIVLRDCNPKLESRAVADAERIVGRYIDRMRKNGQPTEAVRRGNKLIGFLCALGCAAVFAAAIYFRLII